MMTPLKMIPLINKKIRFLPWLIPLIEMRILPKMISLILQMMQPIMWLLLR